MTTPRPRLVQRVTALAQRPWIPAHSIFSGRELARGERAAIALLIGIAAGLAAWLAFQRFPEMAARDFTYPWRAGRALVAGQDPYVVIRPTGPSPNDMWFMYPLTAAMAVLPLSFLVAQVAGAAFVAISAALLAYVISDRGMGRLWLFLSTPFAMAVVLAQWSPLLMAAALTLPLAWALTCKPTLGLALFAYRPRWQTAAIGGAFIALAFLLRPGWMAGWLHAARTVAEHPPPVLRPWGALPLLAMVRWRRPEARLVAVMALVPQNLYFYDQLPLWFVARSGWSAFTLTVLSWVAYAGTRARCHDPFFCGPEAESWVIWLIYVPATVLALVDRESILWLRSAVSRVRA